MREISDRARDRLKMLVEETGFDAQVGLLILKLSPKTEDEIFNYLTTEIRLLCLNAGAIPVPVSRAGLIVSEQIAQVFGWKPPVKLGPQKSGNNVVSLDELTEMQKKDRVAFDAWIERLNKIVRVQVQ